MKKAILISIQPQWVEKILNGEKTIEIRKSMPKCELPIDVYIYCTKGNTNLYKVIRENYIYFSGAVAEPFDSQIGFSLTKEKLDKKYRENVEDGFSDIFTNILNGKVIAKFTLNRISGTIYFDEEEEEKTCLAFAWNIGNLEVFDKPLKLSDFYKNNYLQIIDHLQTVGCDSYYCTHLQDDGCDIMYCPSLKIKKAPRSWCYVYKEV